jgi:hypothetical protein
MHRLFEAAHCTMRTAKQKLFGWVDDVCILAISNSCEGNVMIMERAPSRADQWARAMQQGLHPISLS